MDPTHHSNVVHAVPAQDSVPVQDQPAQPSQPEHLTLAKALVIGLFVSVGCLIFLVTNEGPVSMLEIFELLGGCGGLAAATIVAVTRGRQATAAVVDSSRSLAGTVLTKAGTALSTKK